MKFHYLKSLSAVALAGMFAMNANAESIQEEFTINFGEYALGTMINTNGGAPNADMVIVESPDGDGNALLVRGHKGEEDLNEAGCLRWDTWARIPQVPMPKGYKLSDIEMIEAVFMPTQEDGLKFSIVIKDPADMWPGTWTETLEYDEVPAVNEWNTATFYPADELVFTEGNEGKGSSTAFGMSFGIFNSTNYYVKSFTFYLNKEVSQREKDEAALDKSTAACFEFNFDEWPVSAEVDGAFSSPYVGSNGGGVNRPDMVIDLGPEGYNNNCAHVIYGGHTNIFVTQPVIVPEGYTFDDLRLIEYDVYVTDLPGEDYTNGAQFTGSGQAPSLKLKDGYPWGWEPLGDGVQRASSGVPTVGEWCKVEFYPSTFNWVSREVDVPVVDENGEPVMDDETGEQVMTKESWDGEKVAEEFGKKTQFWMSFGFRPCENQCYVDNIKLWFQKGGEENAVNSVSAVKANDVIYNVYGQRVDESYRGIVIKNGKKYINK